MALTFEHVTFDCADAARLAGFWAAALGWDVAPGADERVAVVGGPNRPPGAPAVLLLRVDEPKAAKNRFHPDFTTSDLEGEVARLVELGATRLHDREEWGTRWTTLADPEGNEFCVVQQRELAAEA